MALAPEPRRQSRVRGESPGSLYRALCKAGEYDRRPRDLTREGLSVLEELGYVHRKAQTCVPSSNGLGLLARQRPPPHRTSPLDNLRRLREWRERQRRGAMVAEMSDKLAEITQFIATEQHVPQRLWTELDRTVRAPHLRPPQPDPGPGAYLRQRSPPPRQSAPAYTFGERLDRGRNVERSTACDFSGPKDTSQSDPKRSSSEDPADDTSCRKQHDTERREHRWHSGRSAHGKAASSAALPSFIKESPCASKRHVFARHPSCLSIDHPYVRYAL